ncbi:hypothetical protein KNO15_22405, partial [Leifsonia shinshuensis]|uniref:RHS repeat-associated core domain-containing protein n=1 Tax=Leifsonia shinshuensis TaxID=150026 RepID=UPI001F5120D2
MTQSPDCSVSHGSGYPVGTYGWSLDPSYDNNQVAVSGQVTANTSGSYRIAVVNKGTADWGAGTYFTYYLHDSNGNAVPGNYPHSPLANDSLVHGTWHDQWLTIAPLPPGTWTLSWDVYIPGVGYLTSDSVAVCSPNVTLTVYNQAPSMQLVSPTYAGTVTTRTPYLVADATDPDSWPGSSLTYQFTLCTNAALTAGCVHSPVTGTSWQVPAGLLQWASTYYWKATVSDGVSTTDSMVATGASNPFQVVVPAPDDWRQVGNGLGFVTADSVVLPYGIFTQTAHDASVQGANMPLSVDRTYSSRAATVEGAFGKGWLSIFDSSLVTNATTGVTAVTYPDGRQETFAQNSNGTWASRADLGLTDRLTIAGDGTTTVKQSSGESEEFTAAGQLSRVLFPDASWVITRTGGEISSLTQEPSGRSISVQWGVPASGCPAADQPRMRHVASLTVSHGTGAPAAVWSYQYNCDRLRTVTDPANGVTTYTTSDTSFIGYTPGGRATPGLIDAGAWYPAANGALVDHMIVSEPGSVSHAITLRKPVPSANGATTDYLSNVNSAGGSTAWYCGQRTIVNNVESCPDGQQFLRFDPVNRLVMKSNAADEASTTEANSRQWIYGSDGELQYFRDENDHVATFDYLFGTLASMTVWSDPQTPVTSTTYVQAGATQNDPPRVTGSALRGPGTNLPDKSNMFTYDSAGRLIARTGPATTGAPAGESATDTYATASTPAFDSTGAQSAQSAPPGLLIATSAGAGTSTYRYDVNGDLTGFTTVGRGATLRTYDPTGLVSSETTTGVGPGSGTVTVTRDALSRDTADTYPCVANAVTGQVSHRVVLYTYDADGLPLTTTEKALDCSSGATVAPDRTTTFVYDQFGRLHSITDAVGATTTYTYDTANTQELTSQTDPRGRVTNYTYDTHLGKVVSVASDIDPPSGRVNVTTHTYAYDPAGRLTQETDADSNVTTYDYSDNDLLTRATRLGVVINGTTYRVALFERSYDAAGNLLTETRGDAYLPCDNLHMFMDKSECPDASHFYKVVQDSGATTTSYTYDPEGRLQSSTLDPTGVNRTTTIQRDSNGRVIGRSVTDGTRTESQQYTVDAAGYPITTTVSTGSTNLATTVTRDANEDILQVTDPNANTTSLTYDVLGRSIQETGPPILVDTPASTATYTGLTQQTASASKTIGYDAFGDITQIKDALGNITTNTYDAAGRITETDSAPYLAPGSTTPLVSSVQRTYSPAGDLVTLTNARGGTTNFSYDIAGNLVKTLGPQVNGARTTTLAWFDHAGIKAMETNDRGSTHYYYYDRLGDEVQDSWWWVEPSSHTDGGVEPITTSTYDFAGKRLTTTDQYGATTTYHYDAAGEITSVNLPGAVNPVTFSYDLAGRIATQKDTIGVTTRHSYDLAGRETSTTSVGTDGTQHVITRTFDGAGNLTQATDPDGATQTIGYNAANLPTTLTQPISAGVASTVSIGYDLQGHQVRTTDGNGNTTWTTYNSWELPDKRIEPPTSAYSALGDRTWQTSYDSGLVPVQQVNPGGVVQTSSYDPLGRVTSQAATDPNRSAGNVSRTFSYTAAGDLASISTPSGTQTFTWGSAGQILTSTGPAGTANFSYSDQGQLDYINTGTPYVSYQYDPTGRLLSVNGRTTTTFGYSPTTGQQTSTSFAGGTTQTSYDPFGRMASQTTANTTGAIIQKSQYTYDADSNILSKTDTGGVPDGGTYTYDQADRLASYTPEPSPVDPATPTTISYAWDLANNKTSESTTQTATTWTYDARNIPTNIATTTASGTTNKPVTSNARGDISTIGSGATQRNLTFDAFDQLTGDGSSTYTYDGLGRISTRNTAPFQYAGVGAQPISAPAFAGGTETVVRDISGGLITTSIAGGTTANLIQDQHDNTLGQITAEPGATLTASNGYSAFGTPRAASAFLAPNTSPHPSAFGYQGDWTDPGTGTVNMQSRWYDPSLGSFLSHDTATQPTTNNSSLNKYAYGNANPIAYTDPTGHYAQLYANPNLGAGGGSMPTVEELVAFGDISLPDATPNTIPEWVLEERAAYDAQLAERAASGIGAEESMAGLGAGVDVGLLEANELDWVPGLGELIGVASAAVLFATLLAPPSTGPMTPSPANQPQPNIQLPPRALPAPPPWVTAVTTRTVTEPYTTTHSSVANGVLSTTETWLEHVLQQHTTNYSDGSWQRDALSWVRDIVLGSKTWAQKLIDPTRPGITITASMSPLSGVVNPVVASPEAPCGLGGTLGSCQTPSRGAVNACAGLDTTPRLCTPAEPTPGPAGATQAAAPQHLAADSPSVILGSGKEGTPSLI